MSQTIAWWVLHSRDDPCWGHPYAWCSLQSFVPSSLCLLVHKLDGHCRFLFQDPGELSSLLAGQHHDVSVVTVSAVRDTAVKQFQYRLMALSLFAHKVKRPVILQLGMTVAAKRLYLSYTRIVRQHLYVIHSCLCFADGHLGAQRCCLNTFITHNLCELVSEGLCRNLAIFTT